VLREAPRRIPAILAAVKEADCVARRVSQVRFPPEPRLVARLRLEPKPRRLELPHRGVEVFELEIDDDTVVVRNPRYAMKREGGSPDRALEPRVIRRIADDLTEAESEIEREGGLQVDTGNGYLVEIHREDDSLLRDGPSRSRDEATQAWKSAR
jgi:hypothetical protein